MMQQSFGTANDDIAGLDPEGVVPPRRADVQVQSVAVSASMRMGQSGNRPIEPAEELS